MENSAGMKNNWMIYGANGYTGRLIAAEAVRRGHRPILAGRNQIAIKEIGQKLGLPTRAFACDNCEVVAKNLEGVALVLHCAGPFSATSGPMFSGCLKAKTNYLDITGEIAVFESVLGSGRECEAAGIVAIPGVGFDVVPSDCLAAMLKKRLPDAVSLSMAMKASGSISPGTLKTVIENIDADGMIRLNGRLKTVSSTYRVRGIRFRDQIETAVTIPWGDVSTAYYSTGIPNTEFYAAIGQGALRFLYLKKIFRPLLANRRIKGILKSIVSARVKGPSSEEREHRRSLLWGEVKNKFGNVVELRLECPEGYKLTVDSALRSVEAVLAGGIAPGAKTPSLAFGAEFVLTLNDVKTFE